MYNILFVKCMSQYDAMNNYIDEWEIVFRSIGFNTCVLDAVDVSIHVQHIILRIYVIIQQHIENVYCN